MLLPRLQTMSSRCVCAAAMLPSRCARTARDDTSFHMHCLAQIRRGAHAIEQPHIAPLSTAEWRHLVRASGGPSAMLDAMEGLLAATLRKSQQLVEIQ